MTVVQFIHGLAFETLPGPVIRQAKRCLLDLIGTAVSGSQTRLSSIARAFASRHMQAADGGARIMFDGRRVAPAGAAFASASTIDAFDAHDGHALTKGHAGAALLPSLLAITDDRRPVGGREFLTCLVLGYEMAIRAGIALHDSVADYHTSGAWNSLGCAAMAARLLGLGPEATRHALGIAEYHGPRSQMMRCIDHPTMVKDGSGWGALAGVSAAFLAAEGFTGAPAITVEGEEHAPLWADLGQRWRILEQYFKPYPVCRWAQPAIEAAAGLLRANHSSPSSIAAVEVETFDEAVRLGARIPKNTEEAQYALAFPLAAFLVRGTLGAREIGAGGIEDQAIQAMARRIVLRENAAYSRRFPAERIAVVTLAFDDGTRLVSPPSAPRGDPETPISDAGITEKFRNLSCALADARRAQIEQEIEALDAGDKAIAYLTTLVLAPLDCAAVNA